MSPTIRAASGRSTMSSTSTSSSKMATRVSRAVVFIRISRFTPPSVVRGGGRGPRGTRADPAGRPRRRRARWIEPSVWSLWAARGAGPGRLRSMGELAQEVAGDHQSLDLARPLADLADLGVAHHALHRVFGGVAVAAVHLHGLGGDAHGRLAGEELGHGRLFRIRLPLLLQPG